LEEPHSLAIALIDYITKLFNAQPEAPAYNPEAGASGWALNE